MMRVEPTRREDGPLHISNLGANAEKLLTCVERIRHAALETAEALADLQARAGCAASVIVVEVNGAPGLNGTMVNSGASVNFGRLIIVRLGDRQGWQDVIVSLNDAAAVITKRHERSLGGSAERELYVGRVRQNGFDSSDVVGYDRLVTYVAGHIDDPTRTTPIAEDAGTPVAEKDAGNTSVVGFAKTRVGRVQSVLEMDVC